MSPAPFNSQQWVENKHTTFHMTLRRDFPGIGDACLAIVGLGNGFVGDIGVEISMTGDRSVSQLREVYDFPRLPTWLLKLVFEYQFRASDYPSILEEVPLLIHRTLEEECGFMVVTLKKCCRGLPLVPSVAKH